MKIFPWANALYCRTCISVRPSAYRRVWLQGYGGTRRRGGRRACVRTGPPQSAVAAGVRRSAAVHTSHGASPAAKDRFALVSFLLVSTVPAFALAGKMARQRMDETVPSLFLFISWRETGLCTPPVCRVYGIKEAGATSSTHSARTPFFGFFL